MDGLAFKTAMTFEYGIASPMVPGISRIVANNPSPFTFKGTNTYLVGTSHLAVVDPGPHDPAHTDAILKAAAGRPITHILSTHAHRDHVDGIRALQAATGAQVHAYRRLTRDVIPLQNTPQGSDFVDLNLDPDVDLKDGDIIAGADFTLTCVHTPGHAPDHMCFAHAESGALLSGDHVMAWNTSVVAPPEGRMSDYIASLERLLPREDVAFLPGHGGRIETPQRTVKAYLLHRRWREQAILKALKDGASTASQIVPIVYPQIAPRLIPAATLTVLAHIEMLAAKGLVGAGSPLTAETPLEAA